jgi:putative transposase
MVSVPVRRDQVAYATRRGLSQRRSCTLMKVARSTLGYCSTKTVRDGPVMARMEVLSAQYPRYGYRRIRIFLSRDGHPMSPGRAHRLWQRAKLQVPRKRPRKRIATGRPRPNAPTGANQVWSYDFVFDWCASGQQLKCLTVTDEWTKEGLAIEVDGRIRSGRVIDVLSRLVSERGTPLYLRSDNGPEFVSRALLKWIVDQGIETALAEWHDREFQRQVPRRVPEPRMVPLPRRGQDRHRDVAQALQRGAPAFEPRLFDAGRVRGEAQGERRSTRVGNGPGRCAAWGLRAPARCITVPQGTFEGTREASRLKLKLVR